MLVYLNGTYVDHTEANVSVGDRGFVFGDGIYEVVRVVEGNFIMEDEHLSRMDEGLEGLKITLRESLKREIPEISRTLIEKNSLQTGEAKVYIQITRGSAWPRTHTFPEPEVEPTVYLSAESFSPHTELHKTGVDAITVSDVRWSRCNLKTVNLLPNTLAKQQATEAGVNSAVMIRDGAITESPNANIFGVKDGTLYTYPATHYILSGITRNAVIGFADELGIPVKFMPIRLDDLFELDELFFSGTTTDIQPVTEVDGKKIGGGKPGPVVRKIQKAYKEMLYGS
ncbi:D-amino-acid transaminase [Rhodohalobacter sp. SW132]|uniref:D-amino-acid transaminase n=1 Tax=Rhodohalobacter sp. SW132 TaxID=2293433 RepID=UPI000E26A179|nr:D-amino-acid transaminase [Rhodohalobacter sp. SW132]REL24137.1 D-amino-acid transaminase [Rhodohalobacter sp. SW132]